MSDLGWLMVGIILTLLMLVYLSLEWVARRLWRFMEWLVLRLQG